MKPIRDVSLSILVLAASLICCAYAYADGIEIHAHVMSDHIMQLEPVYVMYSITNSSDKPQSIQMDWEHNIAVSATIGGRSIRLRRDHVLNGGGTITLEAGASVSYMAVWCYTYTGHDDSGDNYEPLTQHSGRIEFVVGADLEGLRHLEAHTFCEVVDATGADADVLSLLKSGRMAVLMRSWHGQARHTLDADDIADMNRICSTYSGSAYAVHLNHILAQYYESREPAKAVEYLRKVTESRHPAISGESFMKLAALIRYDKSVEPSHLESMSESYMRSALQYELPTHLRQRVDTYLLRRNERR